MTNATSPVSQDAVWRWGQRLLWTGLAGSIALSLLVAWLRPELAFAIPLLLVGVGVIGVLVRYPLANLGAVMLGFVFAVNSDPGLQVSEVVYGLYLYTYLLLWYAVRLLRRERMVFTTTDRVAAAFILGGGLLGTVLGLVFGADPGLIRGDLTAFFVLALYFPVKEACRAVPRGPEVVVVALLGLGVFLSVQNFVTFRMIVSSADHLWEITDARFAATEALIMVGALGTLFLLLDTDRWRSRLGLGALLLFMLAALVLTKGRTFWIVFLFGVFFSLFFLGGRGRFRLIFLTVGGLAFLFVFTTLFFSQLADLIFSGTLNRFATLEGAASRDISLIGRFVEWEALWDYIKHNPILGYGFGTTYRFYNIIVQATIDRPSSHNGYLAAWFKLGIFGLVAMLFFWCRAIYDAFKAHRSDALPAQHRTYALISLVSLAALALAANLSVFFIYMNQLFLFALLTGMASGLRQRSTAGRLDRTEAPAPTSLTP